MSDDDTEEPYNGDIYWDAVRMLATFILHRTQEDDGVTADRLLAAFCANALKELSTLNY